MGNGQLFKISLPASGKGLTEIIWLHGWGQTHKSLLPLANLFKRGFKNTLYDLPGFGASDMLEAGAGTNDYANHLIKEIENKAKTPVILVGHSFGCRVSLRLAASRPDLVRGMVLIAAAGLPRRRTLGFRLKSLFLKTLGKMAGLSDQVFKTTLKEKYRQRFGSRDYREAGDLLPTFIKTVNENLTETAHKVSCPVLLLYGSEDLETPPSLGLRFRAMIHHGDLKILKGFDHLGILTAGQHQCQHYMTKFLQELKG
jgi:pimeloyl-ACP methyl ester carboxylesterase